MRDTRMQTLARNLIHNSLKLQPGEKVLIEMHGHHPEMVNALLEAAYEAQVLPFLWLRDASTRRAMLMGTTLEQIQIWAENDAALMRQMDGYISFRGGENSNELADVPAEKLAMFSEHYMRPVHFFLRIPSTRWVVLRYPSPSMAQLAERSTESFEDYYFQVCNLDYSKMAAAMEPLRALMERTDRVRITGPGTDLSFSIQGMPAIPCAGSNTIPDGEIYTAPVMGSMEGVITYNTPSLYDGLTFEGIRFRFEKGRIVESSANLSQRLEEILNTDEGARCVGEFSLGVNPYIHDPMKDTLFDEKIAGSIHLTPGNAYGECDNGNHSSIHWDLVLIQTPAYGGGEIYFDDVLIRKDGRFVPEELACLNPENLV